MPELSEIEYSRDATVTAVRDYYQFLTQMYLDESDVRQPPDGGWPDMTPESMRGLGKTDEVILLLRNLPYIQNNEAEGAAWCVFANWHRQCNRLQQGIPGEKIRLTSEGLVYKNVPPHVVSLCGGGSNNPVFLLDTELGIVHFCQCPEEIYHNPSRELILDDYCDYAPENEQNWRGDSPAWPITDFFELLKDQFRKLSYIPMSSRSVIDVYAHFGAEAEGMIPMLQDIYRKHDWPDLNRYRKEECLSAVQRALTEQYPNSASFDN